MNKRTISILAGIAVTAFFLIIRYSTLSKQPVRYMADVTLQVNPRADIRLPQDSMMAIAEKTIAFRASNVDYNADLKDRDGMILKYRFTSIKDTATFKDILTFGEANLGFWELYNVVELAPLIEKLTNYKSPNLTASQVAGDTGITVVFVDQKDAKEEPVYPDPGPDKEFVDTSEVAPGLKRYVIKDKAREKHTINGIEVPEITLTGSYSSNYGSPSYYPSPFSINVNDTAALSRLLRDTSIISLAPFGTKFCYGRPGNHQVPVYAIKTKGLKRSPLGNDDIQAALADYTADGRAVIKLHFNPAGTRKWEKMTGENINKGIAITIDDVVITAPIVQSAIAGGNTEINGYFSMTEAENLAMRFDSGTMPVELDILELKIVQENLMLSWRFLLFPILAGLIAGGLTWLIFKSLKTS